MSDSSKYKSILHFRLGASPGCSLHYEEPLPIVIARHKVSKQSPGMAGDCHAGSSLRSEFQLTAMTGKGDNDKARKQCVTNHMNENRGLTSSANIVK